MKALFITLIVFAVLFYSLLLLWFWRNWHEPYLTDWNEEFIAFLSERGVYWLYQPEPNDAEPEEFVIRMTSYNGRSCYWRKLNSEWLQRIEKINTNNK